MKTYIMTCNYSGYKVESRTHKDECCIAEADTDQFNNPITDINCYTIDKIGTEYTITVDKNAWLEKLTNELW